MNPDTYKRFFFLSYPPACQRNDVTHTLRAVFLSESGFLSQRGKDRLGRTHFLDGSLLFWKHRRCLSEGSLLFPPSPIPSVSMSASAGRYTHAPNKQGHLQTLWMYEISLLSGNLVFFSFFVAERVRSITRYGIHSAVTCLNSHVPGGPSVLFCSAVWGFLEASSSPRHNFSVQSITKRHERDLTVIA